MSKDKKGNGEEKDQEKKRDEREKSIKQAIEIIEKQFGKGAIMRLGAEAKIPEVEFIPTGSLGLDLALGVGGMARGRVLEIFGPESSGKTTLALHLVAEAQKLEGICAFIDAEHALDVNYAQKLGVKVIHLPEDPQIAGAVGAAVIAAEKVRQQLEAASA